MIEQLWSTLAAILDNQGTADSWVTSAHWHEPTHLWRMEGIPPWDMREESR